MSTQELGKLFPITLSEHRKTWKQLYLNEKFNISNMFGTKNSIRIEHIGSTAVPGLIAKPTIDILVQIDEKSDLETIIDAFKKHGYSYLHQPENPAPHMMFTKGYTITGFNGQAFHVHIRFTGDHDQLYFRDFLISNPKIGKEYEQLKISLQKKFMHDREAYTDGKSSFVLRITTLARNEALSQKQIDQ